MLSLENVEAGYSRALVVLRGLSLEVGEGQIVALLGANGAGKTTTLKAIMGLIDDEPRKGRVQFLGQNLTRATPEAKARAGMALVPEGRGTFSDLSVLENLRLGAFHRPDPAGVRHDLEAAFARFPRLAERQHQHAGTLSGGEQQMLAISRALMSRPKLLMLDEPSLGLAPKIVAEIFGVITEINKSGVTVMLIEQNARQALEIADKGYVLESGRVVLEGSAKDLRENANVQQLYLGLETNEGNNSGVGRYKRKRNW
jgi:branched-chain amino acid transport system ATP-binding protein